MFGKNPARAPVKGNGLTLDVQEIFPTLQGEGPLAGSPATFVRLGGCNLTCSFCDTEFESFREMGLGEILNEVRRHAKKLVVITGGEPFRQPIEKLCEALIEEGFKVQIETNGTLFRPVHEKVQIIVSPKNTGIGYQPIRPDIMERAQGVKFIISAQDKLYGDIAEVGQSASHTPVFVQPMDEQDNTKNAANLKRCLELSAATGARLSLQLHKILGIP